MKVNEDQEDSQEKEEQLVDQVHQGFVEKEGLQDQMDHLDHLDKKVHLVTKVLQAWLVYQVSVDCQDLLVLKVPGGILDFLALKDLLVKWETEVLKELLGHLDLLVKLVVLVIQVQLDQLVRLDLPV